MPKLSSYGITKSSEDSDLDSCISPGSLGLLF
ncbi:hypothetical protein [Klebsiella phage pKP-BM327-1.2]|nr:hypothetical protein [Klebsiella phage pKP-BM327-1.2]